MKVNVVAVKRHADSNEYLEESDSSINLSTVTSERTDRAVLLVPVRASRVPRVIGVSDRSCFVTRSPGSWDPSSGCAHRSMVLSPLANMVFHTSLFILLLFFLLLTPQPEALCFRVVCACVRPSVRACVRSCILDFHYHNRTCEPLKGF